MTIYQKLLSARERMSFKKEYNSDLKYDILSADAVLEMVGDALASVGVLFVPSMTHAEMHYETREKTYKNGDVVLQYVQHALATIEITFIDTEDGTTLNAITHGSAQDFGDKALGKAQTYAIKYFFFRMFLKGQDDFNDEENMSAQPQRDAQNNPKTAPKQNKPSAAPKTRKTPPAQPQPDADGYDPTLMADTKVTQATVSEFMRYMVGFMPQVDGRQEHAANAMMLGLVATGKFKSKPSWGDVYDYKNVLSIADLYDAIVTHYADGGTNEES